MEIIAYRNYVTPDNVQTIIPKKPPTLQVTHLMNTESASVVNQTYVRSAINDYTVVFMCVDNIKTRYELSKYMETFDSCLLFNGGNSKTSGHVTAYERCRGEELDPPLYEIYPNVTPDADKRPDELDCGTVSPEHDQVAVTNSMIANVMLAMFARWCRQGLSSYGRNGNRRYNEVLINCDDLTMTPLTHPRK